MDIKQVIVIRKDLNMRKGASTALVGSLNLSWGAKLVVINAFYVVVEGLQQIYYGDIV